MCERQRPRGIACAIVLLVSTLSSMTSPPAVLAQDSDVTGTALARRLFHEAVELSNGGDHAEAAERYRRVLELRPSPVVRWNLAHELVGLGQLVEATELLENVRRDETADPTVRESAEALIAPLRARVGQLTLRLDGDLSAIELELDGRSLAEAAVGVATPVDPGTHDVNVRRGGAVVASGSTDVAEGGVAELVLLVPRAPAPSPELAAQSVASGPLREPVPLDDGGEDIAENGWFWASLIGLVALGVGATLIVWFTLVEPPGDPSFEGNLMPGRVELGR